MTLTSFYPNFGWLGRAFMYLLLMREVLDDFLKTCTVLDTVRRLFGVNVAACIIPARIDTFF